jgi:hypothetical protein
VGWGRSSCPSRLRLAPAGEDLPDSWCWGGLPSQSRPRSVPTSHRRSWRPSRLCGGRCPAV